MAGRVPIPPKVVPPRFEPFSRPCKHAEQRPHTHKYSNHREVAETGEFNKASIAFGSPPQAATERLLVGENPEPPICVGKIERKWRVEKAQCNHYYPLYRR